MPKETENGIILLGDDDEEQTTSDENETEEEFVFDADYLEQYELLSREAPEGVLDDDKVLFRLINTNTFMSLVLSHIIPLLIEVANIYNTPIKTEQQQKQKQDIMQQLIGAIRKLQKPAIDQANLALKCLQEVLNYLGGDNYITELRENEDRGEEFTKFSQHKFEELRRELMLHQQQMQIKAEEQALEE